MNEQIRNIKGLPYKNLYVYWQHYWDNCLDTLMDKDNVSFKIVGPRMLLIDLIDELEGHGMANQDNISYFRTQISSLDKYDEVFHLLCHPIIACLLQRLSDKMNRESCIYFVRRQLIRLLTSTIFCCLLIGWQRPLKDPPRMSLKTGRRLVMLLI